MSLEDGMKVIDVLKIAFNEVYEIEKKMHKLEEQMKVFSTKGVKQRKLK